jgi:hypothetical protein
MEQARSIGVQQHRGCTETQRSPTLPRCGKDCVWNKSQCLFGKEMSLFETKTLSNELKLKHQEMFYWC